jgi:S1-C subfamily serine protease
MKPWIALIALTLAMTGMSHGQASPWKQSELNETYMRTLTRSQCVAKLLTTYEKTCGDDRQCLQTIAGAFGDCYAWSRDDVGSMCEYLPPQVDVFGVNPNFAAQSLGSGVVIERGVVATNCHVLRGALGFTVRYKGKDYPARIRHADILRDVCTLSCNTLNAPPVGFNPDGTKQLDVGDKVYAVGAPRGLELTLSDGLLSGFREEQAGRLVQITAPISPGSSGGGLYDQHATLIGLTTLYLEDSQQLNFAVPVEWIHELPQRSQDPANLNAAKKYAAEAATELEKALKAEDPNYMCKKNFAVAEVKKVQANLHPMMALETFRAYYDSADSLCRK